MTSFIHIRAILHKQIKDALANRLTILIFLLFPLLSIVFKGIVNEEELKVMLPSFITMNTVMIPIISMSSSIAEEKEKHSLRMLIMSNVKAWEYIIGMSMSVFCTAFSSSLLFLFFFDISGSTILVFFVATTMGIIFSLLIGAILALLSKNQMSIGPITAPVSMIIGLFPMFAKMNDKLETPAKFLYSYYIREMFETFQFNYNLMSLLILIVNFLVLIVLFILLYKNKGLLSK